MKKMWYATKELKGVAGLPKSVQGINKMAHREGWQSRKRLGVQGRGVEYNLESLPEKVVEVLTLEEQSQDYHSSSHDPLAIWIASYHHLSSEEQQKIVKFIIREGVNTLLSIVDKNTPISIE